MDAGKHLCDEELQEFNKLLKILRRTAEVSHIFSKKITTPTRNVCEAQINAKNGQIPVNAFLTIHGRIV